MDENKGFAVGTKKCGLLCGAIGALAALCWVLFGFWNMIFIAAMFAVGYFDGATIRRSCSSASWIASFPRRASKPRAGRPALLCETATKEMEC